MEIRELIEGWNRGDGKPMKGSLIDVEAFEAGAGNCAMCAQGQVLHLYGGWEPKRLHTTPQSEADTETAKLLNISRAHAVLLRNINDRSDGAPSVVLTDPAKVLGSQWSKLLDFWWAFDQFDADQWRKVAAAWVAAGDAARVAAGAAAGAAAWVAAGDAARVAAGDAAGAAAWVAAGAAARVAAGAAAGAAAWVAAGDAARVAAGDAAGAAAWVAAGAAARVAAGAAAGDAAGAAARVAAGAAAWVAAGDAARVAAGEIQGFEVLTLRGRDVFFLPMFGWNSPADIPSRPADYGNGVVPGQPA